MIEWYCLAGSMVLAFVGTLAMHWFPRDLPVEVARFVREHPFELILRYVMGVTGILTLFTAARLAVGDWVTPVMLWAIAGSAGAAVILGYLRDRAVDRDARLKMQENRDHELPR